MLLLLKDDLAPSAGCARSSQPGLYVFDRLTISFAIAFSENGVSGSNGLKLTRPAGSGDLA